MALDRDELAARATAARAALLALCDALRPEAVAPAPSRPEWVRITGPKGAVKVTVGNAYRVVGWHDEHGGGPIIECDGTKEPWRCYPPDKADSVFPSWEPLAAPSPAATPAAWVPSVGDVVKQVTETDAVALRDSVRVVVSTSPLRWVYVEDGKGGEWFEPKGWEDEVRFVRPATSSERAAAGLPVDESATKPVDREGLARAIREADFATDIIARWPWEGLNAMQREVYFKRADAAIAFMAKGGAS